MNTRVVGGLLGVMAGADAFASRDADAAAFPNGIRSLERFLIKNPDGSLPQPGLLKYQGNGFRNVVGTMEDRAFQAWKALGQAPANGSNLVESSAHPLAHRYNKKPRQTLSQTEQDMIDLLDDNDAILVTNYNGKPGEYGLLGSSRDGAKIFSPLKPGAQKTYMRTVFRPDLSQMQRMHEVDSAGRRLNPPCMNTQNALIPQPVPISAVGRAKKTLSSAAIIASGLDAFGQGKNQSEYTGSPDLPLEDPAFDPIEVLVGGIAGIGRSMTGRMAGMAGDAAVGFFSGILDLMKDSTSKEDQADKKQMSISGCETSQEFHPQILDGILGVIANQR